MNSILTDHYFEILKEVGRWKIISMKSLYELGSQTISYQAFCKKIKTLENRGLLKNVQGMRKRKLLTLSDIGASVSPYGISFNEKDLEFNHDLITTNFITRLLEFKNFKSAQVQSIGFDLEPDGIIYGLKNEKDYSLAVEVELTQKSKERVLDKISRYYNSGYYDYLFYIFNKESVFESYKRIVCGLDEEVLKKVILLFNEEISKERFEYIDSKCFFKKKMTTFKEIFDGV